MSTEGAKASSFKNWILGGVLCVLLIGIVGFFLIFHLGLRIPLAKLEMPFGIIAVLTLLAFPAMYWANRSDALRHDILKRRVLVLGAYLVSTSLVEIHYAARAGIMPTEDVAPLSIIMTIGLAISFVSAYFIRKRIDT